jgi:hypothetical protein
MDATVECRSDSTYAEKPMAVTWAGLRREVVHSLSRSRTPEGWLFRTQTADGLVFELFYAIAADEWNTAPA